MSKKRKEKGLNSLNDIKYELIMTSHEEVTIDGATEIRGGVFTRTRVQCRSSEVG